jgi:hypothetical protein
MMLYLRMIACWLEHTRLFIKVYNKKSKNVSLVHQRKKLKRKKRGKIDESAPSAKRGTLRCTPPIDRLCDCEIEWKLYRRAFSRFVLRSHKFAALLVHRLVATLARHGVSAAAQEEKKGTKQREKNLSRLIRKQNIAHVPSSTAFGVIFRVRPPHVCKAHFYA